MNHNQVLFPHLYINYSSMHMPVTTKHDIQFPHFSSTKKAVYRVLPKKQRITYLKTQMTKQNVTILYYQHGVCLHNTAKRAGQNCISAKILCMFFCNAYEINNVSTIRTRHYILRQQISSEQEQ